MENTDNTLREMQEQMQQLREKLDNQKIINEQMMQKSCRQNASRLKFKANIPLFAGILAILLSPAYLEAGASMAFVIFTCILMLVCIVATILTNRHIPAMDKDLVTAASELTRFKKIHAEWIKVAIPMIIVWFGLLVWDILRQANVDQMEKYAFIIGILVGITLGTIVGLKLRRDQMNAADELLEQIEDLRKED